jgi:hypothetical protein
VRGALSSAGERLGESSELGSSSSIVATVNLLLEQLPGRSAATENGSDVHVASVRSTALVRACAMRRQKVSLSGSTSSSPSPWP